MRLDKSRLLQGVLKNSKVLRVRGKSEPHVYLLLKQCRSFMPFDQTLGGFGLSEEGFLFVFLYCIGFVINISALFFNSLDEIIFLRLPDLS